MSSKKFGRLPFIFLCLLIIQFSFSGCDELVGVVDEIIQQEQSSFVSQDHLIRKAFKNRQSDVWVEVAGKVIKTLPDDQVGSAHQRFIIQLSNNQTILVSHNIDLAPRINGLTRGDHVLLRGEYEYNEKGGVIHWTHHDPQNRHSGGWIEFNGKRYQ